MNRAFLSHADEDDHRHHQYKSVGRIGMGGKAHSPYPSSRLTSGSAGIYGEVIMGVLKKQPKELL